MNRNRPLPASATAVILLTALALAPERTPAQAFPAKPIRFVVSYPAGGGVDLTGRLVAPSLGARLGQAVVVENRPGAGGTLGTAAVAKAAPDGYTVLVGSNAAITMSPHLQPAPYDALKDLIPLVKAANVPTVITVAGNAPYRTLRELLDAAKAQPGRLSYGTPGNGSGMHVELEMLKERLGLDIVHIPYKGAPPIITDTMAGQITVGAPGLPPTVGNIKAGKLKLLAVWSTTRAGIFPEVPTVREVAGHDLDGLPTWYGFMLPAGTPRDIVARLETEIVAVLKDPEVSRRFAESGADVVAQGSAGFAEANRVESASFATLFKKLNIRAE